MMNKFVGSVLILTFILVRVGLGEEDSSERFVPRAGGMRSATVELRSETRVVGPEVTLRQLGRWSAEDEAVLAPVADLVVVRLSADVPSRAIGLDEIRSTLRDAGANLGAIRFSGSGSVRVVRRDAERRDIDTSRQLDGGTMEEQEVGSALRAEPERGRDVASRFEGSDGQRATLRDRLIGDLAERLDLPVDSLQVRFDSEHDRVLEFAEPHFRFDIAPRRVHNLGSVAWDVSITTAEGTQRLTIAGTAQAWQRQTVVEQAVGFRQVIRDEDVSERRRLVDRLGDHPVLDYEQVVGQQAARELRPGTVVSAQMIEAVPLVRRGQLVTVTVTSGSVEIRTVARALETGAYGQSVRVRNESTRDTYEVVVTAPQAAVLGQASGDR